MNQMARAALQIQYGEGPGAVGKTACLESQRWWVRDPFCSSSFKETKKFLSRSLVNIHIVESLCDREEGCSASNCLKGSVISFISPSSRGSPGPV